MAWRVTPYGMDNAPDLPGMSGFRVETPAVQRPSFVNRMSMLAVQGDHRFWRRGQ
jgi:hypothetical protein